MTKRIVRRLASAAAVAAFASLGSAGTALAGQENFCQNIGLGSGAGCYGARHSLTAVFSANPVVNWDHMEAASALDTNYQQYGSWAYNYGIACHLYSGSNLLYPWIYNPMATSQTLTGIMRYGADGTCNLP